MLPQKNLQESVMYRVRAVFVFRSLLLPALIELVAVGMFFGLAILSVSFDDVLLNLQYTISHGSVLGYVYSTVMNTEITMQIFALIGLGASVYFIYRVIHTFKLSSREEVARA